MAGARTYTPQEARIAWAYWKKQPLIESNFHAVCDLLQDIAQTDISMSYEILREYAPMVAHTGNKHWFHILLMGWAKAKESLTDFPDAEGLYRQARDNAGGDARRYDEALVGTVLLYAEWGKADSVDKYLALGKTSARAAGDSENLSFLYTFGAVTHLADTAAMGRDLRTAMALVADLPNRNALFTARYNYANIYCRNDPQQQVSVLEGLLELARDSTLTHHYRLYERTAFCFRNPGPNIYLQLMQVNFLLADYDNAGKFGELLYDAVVKPNPASPQAPFFTSELAIAKAYQGDYRAAQHYLDQTRILFKVPENKIPYPSFFLAAGMIDEHAGNEEAALGNYAVASRMGGMEGLHLEPSEIYYAHALISLHRLEEAGRVLDQVKGALPARLYTAYGFYYYRAYAELLKAKGDYPGYSKALEQYYSIKDSLTNLNHYRAIEQIEARVRLKDKEEQIDRLKQEQTLRAIRQRQERIFFGLVFGLTCLLLFTSVGYGRKRISAMRKQHRIDVMEGAIEAEQTERHKIADRLHDEVGGLLSLATLNLSSALEKQRSTPQSEEQLQKARQVLLTVSTTIRELSHRLTPLAIEKQGFRWAVEDLVETVNLSHKLVAQLVIIGFDDEQVFPPGLLNDIFRILQELVQNILKHAQATAALLEIIEHPGMVSILVEDDGIGIREGVREKTKGLYTIRQKIAYFNGRFEISKKHDKGTLIIIELPFVKPGKYAVENTNSG